MTQVIKLHSQPTVQAAHKIQAKNMRFIFSENKNNNYIMLLIKCMCVCLDVCWKNIEVTTSKELEISSV